MTSPLNFSPPVPVFILMGTCGCGKTTIAKGLVEIMKCSYFEGDTYHSKSNIEKMSRGQALTDDDRWDWLKTIRDAYAQKANELLPQPVNESRVIIVTCSSLRKVYRDILRDVSPNVCNVTFVYLKGSYKLIESRMSLRKDHYMGLKMLDSQFNTLEPPDPNQEQAIIQDIEPDDKQIIAQLVTIIRGKIPKNV